ncbi:Sugar or nucleoside kinase, ribokinase family [Actinacidiphila rubida]|uniref:Sugar or nucleoside kinase, ribokinase family n=1 Tax=Actinacidiphila rubida TaxID=310780 RepID=A0A1H8KUI6_9ACTN|nr:PfkB family carbohydrate kinase [Actinacidiphila rubida]SEN96276.1 Sugar or nucleoside kinase, ribokinase family [Actinacidiphila rubida]
MTAVTAAAAANGVPGAAGGAPGLLVVGDVVTDVVARHAEPLAPHTDTAARIAVLPGGAGANVACWAARCGARVRLLARAGADSADWHRAALLAAGVEPALRVDPELPTAVVVALVDAAAERTLVTDSGAAFRLGPEDWDEDLLDGSPGGHAGGGAVGRVHLSGYLFFCAPGRELATAVRKAALARGIPVSVDPASAGFLRGLGTEAFLDAVRGVDLLLPNAAEAALLSGRDEPAAAAAELSARIGGGTVVVTLGAGGALAAEAGAVTVRSAAPRAAAVDSTGAGDAFTGALLAARLAGADLAAALDAGCLAGARAVTVAGGRPPLSHDAPHTVVSAARPTAPDALP